MPVPTPAHLKADAERDLTLPPPFTQVRLRELGDAFAHAQSIAAAEGAGTLVHVGRFDLAEFAVVLEPDEPLLTARRAFYAGMAALTDALIGHAEPETIVSVDWPDAIMVNHGVVGGGRLAWPEGTSEDETPAWLVFGAMIRTAPIARIEPGGNPSITTLVEEGFDDFKPERLVESFARNLMFAMDAWQEGGFAKMAKAYLERLPQESGIRRNIEDNGDLVLRRAGTSEVDRRSLLPMLESPRWFDPVNRMPRL